MKNYLTQTDEDLILSLRQGESEVMDYLLEKYKPMVRGRCNALYLMGGETEDLIQEGMIGLFKAIRDYNPDRGSSFSTFAQLCVNRQLYHALEISNRKKNQPLNGYISFSEENGENGTTLGDSIPTEEGQDPEHLILEQEKIREFYAQMQKKLSTMEQRVLTLYLEGDNYIRIAERMNKSPKSIDNALQRIRSKVRNLLEP